MPSLWNFFTRIKSVVVSSYFYILDHAHVHVSIHNYVHTHADQFIFNSSISSQPKASHFSNSCLFVFERQDYSNKEIYVHIGKLIFTFNPMTRVLQKRNYRASKSVNSSNTFFNEIAIPTERHTNCFSHAIHYENPVKEN
jgi:hypothetical protein